MAVDLYPLLGRRLHHFLLDVNLYTFCGPQVCKFWIGEDHDVHLLRMRYESKP